MEKTTRKYRDHTLILETTFETADFAVMLIDFMPIRGTNSDIVRIVKGIRGSAPMKMEMSLRFNYGATVPWVTRSDGGIHAIAGPDLVVLRTKAPLTGEGLTTVSEFTVNEGESVDFVMTYGPSHLHAPRAIDVNKALAGDAEILGEMGRRLQLPGTLPGRGGALADHSESSHLSADGRDRRRGNHLPAGTVGRPQELGLSLLLAARRDLHPAGLHAWRLLPGGKGLAAVVAARHCRQSRSGSDHVWHCRSALSAGTRNNLAFRI